MGRQAFFDGIVKYWVTGEKHKGKMFRYFEERVFIPGKQGAIRRFCGLSGEITPLCAEGVCVS